MVAQGEGSAGRGDLVVNRHLDWPGCRNARDLGGLPLSPAGETRFGALIRSDLPGGLSPLDSAILDGYGVRSVIDLRAPRELTERPNPMRDSPGYRHVPMFGDRDLDFLTELRDLPGSYLWKVDNCREAIAAILTEIAKAPPGGVLFHCLAGKDRTGVVAALLLTMAGVGRDAVVEDYRLSDGTMPTEFRPVPEVMLGLLDHLDHHHGGVPAYLEGIGVGASVQETLRRRLTR
jgi:protein tyrosine/serine phosphatase